MRVNGYSPSLWKKVKEEGFISILGKLLFLILVWGLLLLLVLEKTGGGIAWILARIPILKMVDVSPVGLYILWLVSLWLVFKIGKQVGMKRGAARERKSLGIAF
jgi:hypothetical protein